MQKRTQFLGPSHHLCVCISGKVGSGARLGAPAWDLGIFTAAVPVPCHANVLKKACNLITGKQVHGEGGRECKQAEGELPCYAFLQEFGIGY